MHINATAQEDYTLAVLHDPPISSYRYHFSIALAKLFKLQFFDRPYMSAASVAYNYGKWRESWGGTSLCPLALLGFPYKLFSVVSQFGNRWRK
jgi:hypothetical protein